MYTIFFALTYQYPVFGLVTLRLQLDDIFDENFCVAAQQRFYTLCNSERKEKDQHYYQVNSKLPAISHGKLMKRSLGTFKKFIKEEWLIKKVGV